MARSDVALARARSAYERTHLVAGLRGVVLAIGLLLLAFALPVLLEVRRDLVVERWQVHHFQLPVLAELRLPASTKEQA